MKQLLVLGLALKLSFSFLAAGQGADIATTGYALGRGCRELNPALRWAESSPATLGALKMGVASGIGLTAYRLYARHPRWAFFVNLAGGSLGFLAASHNTRVCG